MRNPIYNLRGAGSVQEPIRRQHGMTRSEVMDFAPKTVAGSSDVFAELVTSDVRRADECKRVSIPHAWASARVSEGCAFARITPVHPRRKGYSARDARCRPAIAHPVSRETTPATMMPAGSRGRMFFQDS